MAKQIYCMNLQHHMGVAESAEELAKVEEAEKDLDPDKQDQ